MWDWFIDILTQILSALQQLCGDWGLAVIILTLVIRILIIPLMNKSTESTAKMQVLQPKMQEIRDKYSDDPQRMNEELKKFYSENHFNMFGGCLPVVLQMPVFFGLFTVASALPKDAHFFSLLPTIAVSPGAMFNEVGLGGSWVYILLVVSFSVLTFIPMIIGAAADTQEQRTQKLTMGVVMGVFMLWIGWTVPTAVLLYYNTSGLWQIVQQKLVTDKVIARARKEAEERLKNAPVEVNVVRKEKKERPHKKSK